MNVQCPDLLGGPWLAPLIIGLLIIFQLRYYFLFIKICSLFDKMVFLSLLNFHSVPAVCCSRVTPENVC